MNQSIELRISRARSALERGDLKRALSEAWNASDMAVRRNDEVGLEAVRDVAVEIRDRASGRVQQGAALLADYSGHCITSTEAGERYGSVWSRLFASRSSSRGTKACPECAETIKAAARVCRFCGHRLDAPEPATDSPPEAP